MLSRRALLAATAALAPSVGRPAAAQEAAPRLAQTAQFARERGTTALIIARHGVTLFEEHAGDAAAMHPLGGVTKALAALLAAALVRDDRIALGEPVALSIGDWGSHPTKSLTTLEHLLTMTSGIAGGVAAPAWWEATALEPFAPPGQQFAYDEAPYQIFAAAMNRKIGEDPADFLARRVFARLGIAAAFSAAPDGGPLIGDGAAMRAGDLILIGELIRRRGVWRARQVVSRAALDDVATPTYANPRFGIGFWLGGPRIGAEPPGGSDLWTAPELPEDLMMATGANGQRLYVVPSRAVVATRMGDAAAWSDAGFLRLLLAGA